MKTYGFVDEQTIVEDLKYEPPLHVSSLQPKSVNSESQFLQLDR